MRPTAPNAPLRPFQIASDSSADCDTFRLIGSCRSQIARHARQQIVLFGGAAFDLDDQHRLGIQRIAGMGERLAGMDRRPVHELQRHRNDAGGDDGIDAGAGDLVGAEARPAWRARLPGERRMRTVTSVTTASWPSLPVSRPSQS